jgi:hypothetical protein
MTMWKAMERDEGDIPIFKNDEGWQVDFDPMNMEWFACPPGTSVGCLFANLSDALRWVDDACGRPWGNYDLEQPSKAGGDIPPEPDTTEETPMTEEDFLREIRES